MRLILNVAELSVIKHTFYTIIPRLLIHFLSQYRLHEFSLTIYILLFMCFVDTHHASSMVSRLDNLEHSYCKQDDSLSLNYNTDNNIRIDDHSPMIMDSPMVADSYRKSYLYWFYNHN